MSIVMTPAKTPVRSPSNEDLRHILGLLGYQVCGDGEHHEREIANPDVWRAALLISAAAMLQVHLDHVDTGSNEACFQLSHVEHNMRAGLGYDRCDDEPHALMRAGRGCCRLVTEIGKDR